MTTLYRHIDSIVIGLVHSIPSGYESVALLVATLGDPLPLVVVALSVAGWELYRRNYVRALVMAGSLVALPAFFVVKETVRRARPVTEHVTQQGLHDFSFPSGHSTGSMAVYGMIFALAYSHLSGNKRLTVTTLCVAVIGLIGLTRVYLGAHFPSDVAGG